MTERTPEHDIPRTTAAAPGAPATVLWAEDNAQDRILIQDAVDSLGAKPVITLLADGVLLLEALEHGPPSLVVLDLKMPRLGGLEALRRIRDHPDWRALPVTIFSSGNQPDEIKQCEELGVKAVVHKPVDFDHFSAAVRHIVLAAGP